MITERDKLAILNGEYGITRDGNKCRYVGLSTDDEYPYVFVKYNSYDKIIDIKNLGKDLVYYRGETHPIDVVGLWEDKPDPFSLERALLGEPVMTRDRSKAYVQAIISQPKELEHYNLIGFGYNGEHKEFLHWDKTGKVTADDDTCDDIIGMWREPEPVSKEITVTN